MNLEEQMAAILANEIRKEIDEGIIIELTHNWPSTRLPYGWAGEYNVPDTAEKRYLDIVKWIMSNIDNPEQNAFWTKLG